MRLISGYEVRRARIEVVPLLDVVFLLLVFFIYAMLSMSTHRGVRVSLPRAMGVTEPLDSLVITVTKANTVMIDEHTVSVRDAVETALDRTAGSSRKVLIYGDRESDLGVAIELLSELRLAGIASVSFLVGKEPGEAQP